MITLRVQSSEGNKRIEVDEYESLSHLYETVFSELKLNSYAYILYADKARKREIISSKSNKICNFGLKHGDMIYLEPINGSILFSDNAKFSTTSGSLLISESEKYIKSNVIEDDVDILLYKMDGKIKRKRDEKLCHHNSNGCCVHCSPMEPFDEQFLKDHDIKHISFHSYLRKMLSGVDRGKFLTLDDISCKIKSNCKGHLPWPKGICSKCQPSAITLKRQTYRHVDGIMFENSHIVEHFLDYWRTTGHQRVGYLYGRYEIHSDTPLGIRAIVLAIYEPIQESSKDFVRILLNDQQEIERLKIVDEIAKKLEIYRIGWIFTDLMSENAQMGTVKFLRNMDTHFLSAHECITAAYFQNQYPNPCRYASSGFFGSKFVTICVTGDSNNQIHIEGYQVSNQCMTLVRDNCLVPSKDAAELGYIRKSSDKQYVPDVFYTETDSYGNEILKIARPLPVAYLLVNVPTSTPLQPQFTFTEFNKNESMLSAKFPIENRLLDGHLQGFDSLKNYMEQFAADNFLMAVSNFHLLIYIATMDTLPMLKEMDQLLEAVKTKNDPLARKWQRSSSWATVEQLMQASSNSPPISRHGSSASINQNLIHEVPNTSSRSQNIWSCAFCTFENAGNSTNCEICHLPRA